MPAPPLPKNAVLADDAPPLPKGAVPADDTPPLPKGAILADDTASLPKDAPQPRSMARNLQMAYDELATPPTFDSAHPWKSGANDFGAGVFGLAAPLFHPARTLDAAGKLLMGSTGDKMSVLRPIAQAFRRNPIGQSIAMLPQIGLMEAAPEAEGMARDAGAAVERGGLGLGDASLGARGPKLFKYGANPARGAYEEGVLPAWSKHSASMKLAEALPKAGERISNAVMGGGHAPLADIARSIDLPVDEARGIIEGPGGGNRSAEPLEALRSSMAQRAKGASAPIYGPDAGTPFTRDEAMRAILDRGRPQLPPPMEDIPLAKGPYAAGRLSQPVRLTQGDRPTRLLLESPAFETPMAPGRQEEFPERLASGSTRMRAKYPEYEGPQMTHGEYIGEIPGERGGPGQIQGVLRQRKTYPDLQKTPLVDLRHPHASATDIWKTIQNLDKNTRFNPDPEVEGVNEVRRQMRGGLRGNLEQAVPGLRPLSQRYGDLKAAEDAMEGTMHSGTSLSRMARIPMFPVESTVGKAMYRGGQMLQDAAPGVRGTLRAAPAVNPISDLRRQKEK